MFKTSMAALSSYQARAFGASPRTAATDFRRKVPTWTPGMAWVLEGKKQTGARALVDFGSAGN